jgi:O-antigen ligase
MINTFLIASYWIGNIFRFPAFPEVAVSFIDVVLLLIFVRNIYYYRRHAHILFQQKLFRAAAGMLVVLLSSLLVASPLYSFQQLFIGCMYVFRFALFLNLLFVPLHFSHKNIQILSGGFFILGLLQYVVYPNLRYLLYLGWDDHYLRLFSSLFDPNFSGVLIVLMLISFLCRPDGNRSEKIDYVLVGMGFFALLLTYSRSAFIVAFVAAIAIAAVRRKFAFFLVAFIVIGCGIMLLPKTLPTEGADLFRTASISARSHEYAKAIRIIHENPMLGIGYNTYRYARTTYFDEKQSGFPSHGAAGVPNSYLFILATSGIIGFAFFLNFLGVLWQEYARRSQLAAPLLSAYICSGLFDNTLVYPFIAVWVFLMLKQTEFAHYTHGNDAGDNKIRKTK